MSSEGRLFGLGLLGSAGMNGRGVLETLFATVANSSGAAIGSMDVGGVLGAVTFGGTLHCLSYAAIRRWK